MKISAKAYAGIKTFLITFLTLFSVTLVGWLNDFAEWAGDQDVHPFPSGSVLIKAGVSAFAAALTGLVNYFVNYGQEKGVVPGQAPTYDNTK